MSPITSQVTSSSSYLEQPNSATSIVPSENNSSASSINASAPVPLVISPQFLYQSFLLTFITPLENPDTMTKHLAEEPETDSFISPELNESFGANAYHLSPKFKFPSSGGESTGARPESSKGPKEKVSLLFRIKMTIKKVLDTFKCFIKSLRNNNKVVQDQIDAFARMSKLQLEGYIGGIEGSNKASICYEIAFSSMGIEHTAQVIKKIGHPTNYTSHTINVKFDKWINELKEKNVNLLDNDQQISISFSVKTYSYSKPIATGGFAAAKCRKTPIKITLQKTITSSLEGSNRAVDQIFMDEISDSNASEIANDSQREDENPFKFHRQDPLKAIVTKYGLNIDHSFIREDSSKNNEPEHNEIEPTANTTDDNESFIDPNEF